MIFVRTADSFNPNRICSMTMDKIKRLGRNYQLFFFFNGDCSQSQSLAMVVQQFVQVYGWTVWAISLNGLSIPGFPNAQQNPGIARRFKIKVSPALIAIHTTSKFYVPLTYGYASLDEVESELEILVDHEEWRQN